MPALKNFLDKATHKNPYEYRVCGMVVPLAQKIRKIIKEDDTSEMAQVCQRIQTKVNSVKNCSNVSFGFVIGTMSKDTFTQLSTHINEDVVIILVSDPLDIDSKWMSFLNTHTLSPDQISDLFDSLYKFDASK